MSTNKIFRCEKCKDQRYVGELFSALLSITRNETFKCLKCEGCYRIHLNFQFALGVNQNEGEVIAAYLPDKLDQWTNKGDEITYYPFLVVLKYNYGKEIWLPYWHVIKRGDKLLKRYGQWAPVIRMNDFMEMTDRAKSENYI